MPLLLVLAGCCFISGMSARLVDPLVPEIARDLGASASTIAMLASAYTLPYALSQPVIGALGDTYGKERIIKICLAWLVVFLVAAAAAASVGMLFLARILGGVSGGGLFPLALAIIGDRFAYHDRQVAISYLLSAVLTAQLGGMIGSGIVASAFGWRAVLWIAATFGVVVLAVTLISLPTPAVAQRPRFSLEQWSSGYLDVLSSRRARACYLAVLIEGCLINGLFPYVASLLEARGAGGIREAGFVLAGVGIGGFAYTFRVARILQLLGGGLNAVRVGAAAIGIAYVLIAVSHPWWLEMLWFMVMGVGFYMMHGSLQAVVTEVAPTRRGTAVSLHAFFFIFGQAVGPLYYAVMLPLLGTAVTIASAGVLLTLNGFYVAHRLSGEEDDEEAGPLAPGFG
jgi:predicted MFS family arabinose efflux permease